MGRDDVEEDEELLSTCGGKGGIGSRELVAVVGFFLSSIRASRSENSKPRLEEDEEVDVADSPRSPRSGAGTFVAGFDLKLPFGRPRLRTTTTGGVSAAGEEDEPPEMIPLLLLLLMLLFSEGLVVVDVVIMAVVVGVAPLELETGEFVPELSRPIDVDRY